ncbi:MAG: PKD domain-containing protein [Bacteroidetes bacterium]|nr:PKD domain-containing protein [Bacteroidota bacterium]
MKNILLFIVLAGVMVLACRKTDYSFGRIKTPSNVSITTTIQGADGAHPAGDGSGKVTVTVTATDALTYKVFFGNGDSVMTTSGTVNYTYTTLDTNTYTIAVNAIGTGGAMSTATRQVRVLYTFAIPADVMTALTNNSSRVWTIASGTAGHFGVGPLATFTADYYKAQPNEKPSCAYDDEITFTKTGPSSISISVDNKGTSFLIGAATAFYGQSGPDNCYPISTGGVKNLSFSQANSGSTSANSTGIQFLVPGNGIVNFGTGANVYEILSLANGTMMLRNVGIDNNAWYQLLKVK